MMKKTVIIFSLLCIFLLGFAGISQAADRDDNPIDNYYAKKLQNVTNMGDLTDISMQETSAWQAEFVNITNILRKKYEQTEYYPNSPQKINNYVDKVNALVVAAAELNALNSAGGSLAKLEYYGAQINTYKDAVFLLINGHFSNPDSGYQFIFGK